MLLISLQPSTMKEESALDLYGTECLVRVDFGHENVISRVVKSLSGLLWFSHTSSQLLDMLLGYFPLLIPTNQGYSTVLQIGIFADFFFNPAY